MNMSFYHTQNQVSAGTKVVTRRIGWSRLKPGQRFWAVVKGQGIKKGQKIQRIRECECVSNRSERLDAITQDDCRREGFPDYQPSDFVMMFCRNMGCHYDTIVNRIEFKYISKGI